MRNEVIRNRSLSVPAIDLKKTLKVPNIPKNVIINNKMVLINLFIALNIQAVYSSEPKVKKVDIAKLNLRQHSGLVSITSSSSGFFLIGKYNEYPIFEFDEKENNFITNCEFCDVKNWDILSPELMIFEESLKNETLYLSGIFFGTSGVEAEEIPIHIEYYQHSYCPKDCSSKGKCLKECKCDFSYTGNSCQTKINKLPLDINKAELLPGHSWTFYYTQLRDDENYIHVEFNDYTSKDLHVYLSLSSDLDTLPSFRSHRNHICFPQKKDMLSRFFLKEKYLLWSFFCTSRESCPFRLELENKVRNRKSLFLHILFSSTVLVLAFVGISFVFIKIFKKLKRKCFSEEENERLITQKVMNQCFPQHQIRLSIENSDSCCICLSQYADQHVRTLGCFHTFHSNCIDIWTANHNSCPLCKKSIFLSDELIRFTPRGRNEVNQFNGY